MMAAQLMSQGDVIHEHYYFFVPHVWAVESRSVKPEQAQQEMTLRLKPEVRIILRNIGGTTLCRRTRCGVTRLA